MTAPQKLIRTCWRTILVTLVLCFTRQIFADEAGQKEFFETRIRPVLARHCYQCHSSRASKLEGGLKLDSRAALRAGGDRGPAIVPGKPDESLLLAAIAHTDADLKMPPRRERLDAQVIADFKTWIEAGAFDPRDDTASGTVTGAAAPVDLARGRQFWAFQKPQTHPTPAAANTGWARRELDHFILARLEATGLAPSPDAAPRTLLRRLHFDLVGLPPDIETTERFLKAVEADGLDSAVTREVDRLLAQPQFGERWGRHWLDVARFAESSGKEANISFPYAWRYRDYVIDAVTADVPLDRFILEQVAGDLLPAKDNAERARLLIATGFLALGPKNLDEADPRQFKADLIDEQIDTVTRAVLGQSVACARCHDHKFDPYSMEDYTALAGIFGSTRTYFGTAVSPSNRVAGDPLVLPRDAGQPIYHPSIPAARVVALKEQLAALKKEQATGMANVRKAMARGENAEGIFTLRDALRIFWTSGGIEGQLEKVDDQGAALPLAMGVLESDRPADAPIYERGEIARPGSRIDRGFPRIIELNNVPAIRTSVSGRLELGQWLTHPDQPLTPRVFVNRVWLHLFGSGLVSTPDNFGFSGQYPSHPELLDTLAVRFVADGWSLKRLVRELVLSRAYRQSSAFRAEAFQTDPDNRLVWRASKRRLDAEAIRDAMLAASGDLDLARPGGSLVARTIGDRPISLIGLDGRLPKDLDGMNHRSVYLPVLRDRLPDVLDLFDFAEPSLVTGARETTNVPVQALYLMNSTFVRERAWNLARRLRRNYPEPERVNAAFELCFGRSPEASELELAQAFLSSHTEGSPESLLAQFCQSLLATAEFRNLD